MIHRLANALIMTLASVPAFATGPVPSPDAWVTHTSTDPVELTTRTLAGRADTESRGVLLVDCEIGTVFIDVGDLLDVPASGRATFRIRFENDPAPADLAVMITAAVPTTAIVDEPRFVVTLAARQAEVLHVAPTMLGAHRMYSFDLGGAADALKACGLDLGALPSPSDPPQPIEHLDDDDPGAGIVGGVVGPVSALSPSGSRVLHHSEARIRHREKVRYPDEARGLGAGEITCRVRVFIDTAGVPERVQIENCPEVFSAAAEEAVMTWRWYPATVEGRAVRAQFLMALKFTR